MVTGGAQQRRAETPGHEAEEQVFSKREGKGRHPQQKAVGKALAGPGRHVSPPPGLSVPVPAVPQQGRSPGPHNAALPSHGPLQARPNHGPAAQPGPRPVPIPMEVPGCLGLPLLPRRPARPPWGGPAAPRAWTPSLCSALFPSRRPSLLLQWPLWGKEAFLHAGEGALVQCLPHSGEQVRNIFRHHLWPGSYLGASATSPTASRQSGALGIGSIRNSGTHATCLGFCAWRVLWLLAVGEATEGLKQQTPSPGEEGSRGRRPR